MVGQATLVKGKSHRPGMYQCNACLKPFTVTVGSVMESSHVPLHKWALAFRLMAASKKGVSAHQLMRMLGLGSYRTAWFMAHRVREAMAERDPEPLGGKGKTVEIDETFIGKPDQTFVSGKGWQGKRGTATKRKVLTMVERGGRAVSVKVEDLTVQTLKTVIGKHVVLDTRSTRTKRSSTSRLASVSPSIRPSTMATANMRAARRRQTRSKASSAFSSAA